MSEPTDTPDAEGGQPPRPTLRLVRGNPTAEELAALLVVLAATSGGGGDVPAPTRSLWASSGRARAPHAAGPGAWRASGLPR